MPLFLLGAGVWYDEIIMGLYEFLDNKRTLWIVAGLLVALVVITVLTTGQYRQVIVQGTIWEWVNAPQGETGAVYAWERPSKEAENWAPPPGTELKPLSGAYITYFAVYKNRQSVKAFAISGKEGQFTKKTREWKATGNMEIIMTVSKDGYNSVNATFTNKGDPNVVHVILTRAQ